MEQRKSTRTAIRRLAGPPAWMQPHGSCTSPDRRAKMLEHMARARSLPQPQAAKATEPSRMSGWDILRDAYGYAVLFGHHRAASSNRACRFTSGRSSS